MTRYFGMPEATAATIDAEGWVRTGDLGSLDDDGFLAFNGRLSDSIRRRGENISAFEVEEVIRTHPAVADVAVYPVRAETSEDEVAATITLRPGFAAEGFDYRSLLEHCTRNLAYFMVPRYVALDRQKDGSWKLDLQKVFDAVDDRTRAIFVNFALTPKNENGRGSISQGLRVLREIGHRRMRREPEDEAAPQRRDQERQPRRKRETGK